MSGLAVQACGDAHLSNFGIFGSAERRPIAAYLGGSDVFDRTIAEFAAAYADQNERDHQALVDAVTSGRLTAEPDM